METETLALAQEIDFSMWSLFMRATFTVKLVMIMLVVASFWAWAIILQRLIDYRRARREATRFDRAFWSGEPLDDLYDKIGERPRGPSERVFVSGMVEWQRSHRDDGALIPGAQAFAIPGRDHMKAVGDRSHKAAVLDFLDHRP